MRRYKIEAQASGSASWVKVQVEYLTVKGRCRVPGLGGGLLARKRGACSMDECTGGVLTVTERC